MSFFPSDNGTLSPFVWLVSLDESTPFGVAEMSDPDGSNRHLVDRNDALLELGGRGEVTPAHPVVPGLVALTEAVGWRVARSVLVASQPTAEPSGQALRPASRMFPGMTWDDLKPSAADQALLLDFALTSFSEGNGGARPRAELSPISETEWAYVEWLRAVRAVNDWHPIIIAGAGTVSLDADCPLFTDFADAPVPEHPEEYAIADLFAEAAE